MAAVLHADPSLIRILLHNLLGNACKYSPAGSVIAMQVETLDGQHLLCRIGDAENPVVKADPSRPETGHSWGNHAKITQSSGLGLFLCQRIVDLHDGKLRLENSRDAGTLALVTLPGLTVDDRPEPDA